MSRGTVLVVDDEPNALKVMSAILGEDGYRVFQSPDVDAAEEVIRNEEVDAVITDLKMPGRDGMQLFASLSETRPDLPVIFLTAYGTVDAAVQAMTRGAYYYFIKPPDYRQLRGIVSRAVQQCQMKKELQELRSRVRGQDQSPTLIGTTPAMQRILDAIYSVKDSASSVLISGETGTGKELVARELQFSSVRRERPFVAVNCAAMPRNLIEAELFGSEKGAYTGAQARRIGRFEEASGGTLFLDEISELESGLQAKLLRVLQEREVERLGSNRKIKVDFRLVSSTNRDLAEEVSAGRFREDLFYRINVVHISLPALRDRAEDIPMLITDFVQEFSAREGKKLTVEEDIVATLSSLEWPGNVRQLRNVIERAVVLAKSNHLTLRELPDEFRKRRGRGGLVKTLRQLEVQAVRDALDRARGNKSEAARILGISRKALYKRLKEAGIAATSGS